MPPRPDTDNLLPQDYSLREHERDILGWRKPRGWRVRKFKDEVKEMAAAKPLPKTKGGE